MEGRLYHKVEPKTDIDDLCDGQDVTKTLVDSSNNDLECVELRSKIVRILGNIYNGFLNMFKK